MAVEGWDSGAEPGLFAFIGTCASDRFAALKQVIGESEVCFGTGLELVQAPPYFPLEIAMRSHLEGSCEDVVQQVENLPCSVVAIAEAHLISSEAMAVLSALATSRRVVVTASTLHPRWAEIRDWLKRESAVVIPVDCPNAEDEEDVILEEDHALVREAYEALGDDQRALLAAVGKTLGRIDISVFSDASHDLVERRILRSGERTVVVQPRSLGRLALELAPYLPEERSWEFVVDGGVETSDVVRALARLDRDTEALELISSSLDDASADERGFLLLEAASLDREKLPDAVGALIDVGRFDDAASLEPDRRPLLQLKKSAGYHDDALELAHELGDESSIQSMDTWPGWREVDSADATKGALRALIQMDPDWEQLAKDEVTRRSSPLEQFEAGMVLATGYALTGQGPIALRTAEDAVAEFQSVPRVHALAGQALAVATFYVSGEPDALDEVDLDAIVGTQGLLGAFRACSIADQGRTGDALDFLDSMDLPTFGVGRSLLQWARAEVELHAGRPHRVRETSIESAAQPDPGVLLAQVVSAWAAFEQSKPIPATPTVRYEGLSGAVAEVDALRAAASGDLSSAAELLISAAGTWAPVHLRGELRCLWGGGEFLRQAGDEDGAAALLTDVEQRASDLGNRPLVARARRSLRRCGLSLRSGGRGDSSELSIREQEVIELVGRGRTSHEIAQELGIARSTVETQIRSAMQKLGVRTRLEAAAKLREEAT